MAKFGHMVTVWNELEQGLRSALMFALEGTCPASPASKILTAHMKNTALCAAFKTAATEFKSGDLRACMLHAVKCVERLREHRNWYAHGFTQVGWGSEPSGEPIGFLQAESANSRLTSHEDTFTIQDLERLTSELENVRDFIGRIYGFMRDGDKPYWRAQQPSWPEMPPLPDSLVKPRRYPLGDAPPPPTSQE